MTKLSISGINRVMGLTQSYRRAKYGVQLAVGTQLAKFLPEHIMGRLAGLGDPPRFSLGLSNSEITAALLVAERGDVYRAWALIRDMFSRNAHLQAEVGKRIMAFIGQKEQILPFNPNNKDDVAAAETCEDLQAACENWIDGLTHLALGHVWPVSGAEKIYEPVDENTARMFRHPVKWRLKKLHPIPWPLYNYRISYYNVNGRGSGSNMLTNNMLADGAAPPYDSSPLLNNPLYPGGKSNSALFWNPDDWHADLRFYSTLPSGLIDWSMNTCYRPDPMRHVLHKAGIATTSMRENWCGALAPLLFWHLLMMNARDGFGRAMERYGSPFAVAYANMNNKNIVDELIKDFQRATNMGALLVPHGTKVELQQAMYSGMADGWSKLISLCKTEITTAVLGQTLSTEAKGTGMGSGVSDLQGEVRDDWRECDELQFGTMELQQIYEPFLRINGLKGRIRSPLRGGLSMAGKSALGKMWASFATAGIFPDPDEESNISRQVGTKVKIYGPEQMAKIQKPPVTAAEAGGNQHVT